MSRRLRATVVALLVLGSVVGLGVEAMAALRRSSAVTASSRHAGGHRFAGQVLDRPLPLPTWSLTDTRGRPFSPASLRGKVVLVYAGYTHCPDACPTTMANLAQVLRDSPGWVRRAVRVVFVTEDPARDTPMVIRRWLDHFSAHFIGLTGSAAQTAAAVRGLGLPEPFRTRAHSPGGGYDLSHVPAVLAFGRDGVARLAYAPGVSLPALAADLRALVGGVRPPPPDAAATSITGVNADFGRVQLLTAYVTSPPTGSSVAEVDMTLVDVAPQPDRLVAVTAMGARTRWRVDGHSSADHVVALPAGQPVSVGQGGLQLELSAPAAALRDGGSVRLLLRFARAGAQTVTLPVVGPRGPVVTLGGAG